MSSHREAPEISKDPVADNTDVYAFLHPTKPDRVVLIANYNPLELPDGGPNFYEFGEDVLYEVHVSNTDNLVNDITYQFRFNTTVRQKSFLYNTGVIENLDDETWNRPQTFSVDKVTRTPNGKQRSVSLAKNLPCPPVNVGSRSTPNYASLADQATHTVGQRKFFAGQRADAFHVDLGSVFDLAGLRPFNEAHVIDMPNADGVNGLQAFNVHTIAIEVPTRELTADRKPADDDVEARRNVIGVWATASRQQGRVFNKRSASYEGRGPWTQVSRLANPLFNEVLVPMDRKNNWNHDQPRNDVTYSGRVVQPELAGLLPALYPGVFPNLADYKKNRNDLAAILLTGIPSGVIEGFQNYTGDRAADLLRLNMAIPPADEENSLGVVGGDLAGFPNGRRPGDDVVTIELRAIAGLTIPLVDPSYEPDAAASDVTDGTTNTNAALLDDFPFLGLPGGGYQTQPGTTSADSDQEAS